MRHNYCEWCGNAPNECECLERASGVVARMIGGGLEAKSQAFKDFLKLDKSLSRATWGELIEKRIENLRGS